MSLPVWAKINAIVCNASWNSIRLMLSSIHIGSQYLDTKAGKQNKWRENGILYYDWLGEKLFYISTTFLKAEKCNCVKTEMIERLWKAVKTRTILFSYPEEAVW
jgi:hypothetical protein